MAKKILVVDDEPGIRKNVELRLKNAGYRVDLVGSGQDALSAYERSLHKEPYDLILLDIIMPGMSGLEVLARIRKDERQLNLDEKDKVAIVMLTALKDSWKEDAISEGCNDYLVKPYTAEALLKIVEKWTSARKS